MSDLMLCCGIISDYKSDSQSNYLRWYVQHASVASTGNFKFGFHQDYPTLFATSCGGGRSKYRSDTIGKKQHVCNECYKFRKSNQIRRVRQLLKQKALNYQTVSEIIHNVELSAIHSTAMVAFLKTPDYSLSARGQELKKAIKLQLDYYKEMKASRARGIVQNENGSIPGTDKFPKLVSFILEVLHYYVFHTASDMFVSYLVPEKVQRVKRVSGVSCCHAMQMFFVKV